MRAIDAGSGRQWSAMLCHDKPCKSFVMVVFNCRLKRARGKGNNCNQAKNQLQQGILRIGEEQPPEFLNTCISNTEKNRRILPWQVARKLGSSTWSTTRSVSRRHRRGHLKIDAVGRNEPFSFEFYQRCSSVCLLRGLGSPSLGTLVI